MKKHAFHSTCMLLLGYNSSWAQHTIAIPKTFQRFQILCVHFIHLVTHSRGGPATGRCGTRASEQAGKALRSQGHQCAHVM